jgi:hypothetical protein
MTAQALLSADLLEAAAYALVTERCRTSYVHEIRGGLQALNSAMELLARAAKNPGENSALAEKAVTLARRALLNHEQALLELVNQVAPQPEIARTVNVGELMSGVLRFIRNDAANKSITFRLASTADVLVRAQARKFRLLALGLCATLADGLDPGAVVDVTVTRTDASAVIELGPAIPAATIWAPQRFLQATSAAVPLYELVLSLVRQWLSANGGRLDLPADSDSPPVLCLSYPSEPQGARHASAGPAAASRESPTST